MSIAYGTVEISGEFPVSPGFHRFYQIPGSVVACEIWSSENLGVLDWMLDMNENLQTQTYLLGCPRK